MWRYIIFIPDAKPVPPLLSGMKSVSSNLTSPIGNIISKNELYYIVLYYDYNEGLPFFITSAVFAVITSPVGLITTQAILFDKKSPEIGH